MSSRERWIVYPLLFMTLGIAVKDKLTRQVSTNRVECKSLLVTDRVACNTLLVTDAQGKPRVIVMPTDEGGIVETVAAEPSVNVILGQAHSHAGLMFTDANSRLVRGNVLPLRRQPNQAPKIDDAEGPPASR